MLGTALLVGGAFGVRHAFEADHVAAVATLVEEGNRPASTGAAWGVGHSIPILLLGALFLALDLRVPTAVATAFEAVVAVVLVALGVRAVAGREALGLSLLRHVHGDGHAHGDEGNEHGHAHTHDEHAHGDDEHAHEHARAPGEGHLHLTVLGREIGLTHSHADDASFAVGVVHGLAGSGGVVVALVAAAPTAADGAGFLLGFAVATVVAMGLAAWGWSRAVARAGTFRVLAGIASIGVGLLLFAEVVGLGLPLRVGVHDAVWMPGRRT
jgi:ABC-type nickel/cobalt efflux system permease component RcnA